MGGCASRPKDADFKSDEAPEAPVTSKEAEAEAVAKENNTDGAESEKKEEPLVDLSEPKEEKDSDTAPAAEAGEKENVEAKAETEEPAEDEKPEASEDAPLVTV